VSAYEFCYKGESEAARLAWFSNSSSGVFLMRLSRVGLVAALAVAVTAVHAESKNAADYPLRVHIFSKNQTTFYHHEYVDDAKGDGRANLFEGGEARGVDFSYDCMSKIKASFGYETYPAKWKKPGKDLLVLFPVFGKTGEYFTCDLKTDLKDFAYTEHDGKMGSESVTEFKTWMVRHDYDPEHGKNMPVKTAAQSASAAQPAVAAKPAAQAQPAPQ
jgi:hypothetical protein